jgi:hypothetical protein
MTNRHYSALDRHAVLTGSNDSFPWFASQMLALESSEVMRLRMEKFAHGGEDCESEARLMVTEKVFAAVEAGMNWLAGASLSSIVGRYREHVAANAKRLSVG